MRFFSLWVSDGLKNWSWLIKRQASQCLESVCVNAAENTRTQPETPLKPKDRCSDTHQRESTTSPPHFGPRVGSVCGASLWDSDRGMRAVPMLQPPLEVSRKMEVERKNEGMERKEWSPRAPPHWITRLVLTFRLHQLLYNILLALVKRELAWEVEAFFALYFDWLLVRVWMKEEGGRWKGKNKNRMGFNEGSWHSCSKTTQNQMKCKLTMHIK